MTTLPPYTDQLDRERQAVFLKLKSFASEFILAGGTAISLQIGHRLSYDFDCFSQKPLPQGLPKKATSIFPNAAITADTGEVMTFQTKEAIDITFVAYPYPILRPTTKTSTIALFHMDDLAANKAYTIGRRGQWRDYVDLFVLLKWKLYTISSLILLASEKYGGEFNEKLFLGQLVYFDDVKIVETVFLKEEYSYLEIKSFLESAVRKRTKEILT